MNTPLLCLNPEWRGCRNPILKSGATKLARQLFDSREFLNIDIEAENDMLASDQGVYALHVIGKNFVGTLAQLRQNQPKQIFTLGGSCGVEVAPVSYLNEYYQGDIAVIWFDAHADINTPESSPSGHFHGMILRTLLGEGPSVFVDQIKMPLTKGQVFLAGVRDLDDSEKTFITKRNIPLYSVDEKLALSLVNSGYRRVYVHIDVDVLNPDYFQDANVPAKGGPTPEQFSASLAKINAATEIVGLSVVEYCGRHSESAGQIARIMRSAGIYW